MSELSTVAIKDGHRGHLPHHQHPQEAAERISRLTGLTGFERGPTLQRTGLNTQGGAPGPQASAYFDQNAQPQLYRERSTVGSASATGSVGGRTTWASGSVDGDKMSEDQDMETASTGGFSDEAASLVGFGEGARTPARQHSTIGSPVVGKVSAVPPYLREPGPATPMTGVSVESTGSTQTNPSTDAQMREAAGRSGLTGVETAERIMQDRIDRNEDVGRGHTMIGSQTPKDVGQFYFEGRQQ